MKANSARMCHVSMRWLTAGLLASVFLYLVVNQVYARETKGNRFEAIGPTEPVKMEPVELGPRKKPAVQLYFDLLPTSMRFHLPAYPCMVTENNIQYSNFFAETYEPRIGGGSFETAMDRRNTYARIIVRVRGALSDRRDNIAHTDIPSGSPYGKGDWVDEWFYIYPDGVYVRQVKIYTGLASRSRPFGFDREPPAVVHEFMEAAVIGAPGHLPTDDIEIGGLTLIKMIGGHSEHVLPGGGEQDHLLQTLPQGLWRFPGCQYHGCKSQVEVQTVHHRTSLRRQDSAIPA